MSKQLTTQELSIRREKSKEYYRKHKERIRAWSKAHIEANKERYNASAREYHRKNKEKYNLACKEYDKKHKEELKQKRAERYRLNKAKMSKKCSEKYFANHEENKRKAREKRNANKERINFLQRQKYKDDIQYKIATCLRAHVYNAMKCAETKKYDEIDQLTGCSYNALREHLERLWLPGMSWLNHTKKGWHIDHIQPIASFDLTDPDQQKKCFHYINLRPLWAVDNQIKNSKFNGKRYYHKKGL
jgi:hypothetical protein